MTDFSSLLGSLSSRKTPVVRNRGVPEEIGTSLAGNSVDRLEEDSNSHVSSFALKRNEELTDLDPSLTDEKAMSNQSTENRIELTNREIPKLASQMSDFEFIEGKSLANTNTEPASHLLFEENKEIRSINNSKPASYPAIEEDKRIWATGGLRRETKTSLVEESLYDTNSEPTSQFYFDQDNKMRTSSTDAFGRI